MTVDTKKLEQFLGQFVTDLPRRRVHRLSMPQQRGNRGSESGNERSGRCGQGYGDFGRGWCLNLPRRVRSPSIWASLGLKGQKMGTGQCNVKAYNRRLRDLIHHDRTKPSVIVSHELPLEKAPEAYQHFDKRDEGWTKVVLHPNAA
jgi:hypothetical protein